MTRLERLLEGIQAVAATVEDNESDYGRGIRTGMRIAADFIAQNTPVEQAAL